MTSAATEQRAPESTRRLTGRDGIRGIKARAAVALQDAFLQRALPVSQDGMRFKRDAAVEAFGHEHFEALRKWAEQLRHRVEKLDVRRPSTRSRRGLVRIWPNTGRAGCPCVLSHGKWECPRRRSTGTSTTNRP